MKAARGNKANNKVRDAMLFLAMSAIGMVFIAPLLFMFI
jgi:multiple sugar transport system permease protein